MPWNINNEYSLEPMPGNQLKLIQYHVQRYKPGSGEDNMDDNNASILKFSNPYAQQPLSFIITAGDSTNIKALSLAIDGKESIKLINVLKEGQALKYTGDGNLKLYDPDWHELNSYPVNSETFSVSTGDHSITFICDGIIKGKTLLTIELRSGNSGELIQSGTGNK